MDNDQNILMLPDRMVRKHDKFFHEEKEYLVYEIKHQFCVMVKLITNNMSQDPNQGRPFEWTQGFANVKWIW